jgi:hypothetical protein
MKSVMLTEHTIESAKHARSHVVVGVFDQFDWQPLRSSLRASDDLKTEQRLCREAVVPFARKLEGQTFTLGPFDIIAIGARVIEMFPDFLDERYPAYEIANASICAYCSIPIAQKPVQDKKTNVWKHIYEVTRLDKNYSAFELLNRLAQADRANAAIFAKQLENVAFSIGELHDYAYQDGKFGAAKDSALARIIENWVNGGLAWMPVSLEAGHRK